MDIIEKREKKFRDYMSKERMMLLKHQHDPFEEYRTEMGEHLEGIYKKYQFPNGYGASVICHSGSYGGHQGLWELAVELHGIIVYDTTITADVLGYLKTEEVNKNLKAIKEL